MSADFKGVYIISVTLIVLTISVAFCLTTRVNILLVNIFLYISAEIQIAKLATYNSTKVQIFKVLPFYYINCGKNPPLAILKLKVATHF